MPEPTISSIIPRPGIQRDGTLLDSDSYVDGQWVRFQRGRPRKMGGYRELSADFLGPVTGLFVWGRQDYVALVSGSLHGVEQALVDSFGVGAALADRTPAGYVTHADNRWSFGVVYDDAVGSDKSLLIAHASRSGRNIDDGTALPVYSGDVSTTAALTAISGADVSGGFVAIAPYLVVYGSDGYVAWSDANQPTNFTTGDAGADRVTPFKIVKGLPIRSGSGPAALLWSLDSVLKMQWVGGQRIFQFDTLSSQSSIISPSSVIEYDGVYYWIGADRFMVFDGSVHELPNNVNLNWFFDGLNPNADEKIWAMKIPRFGEIMWFYPRGTATECTHAVVYNIREQAWYDFALQRSAGYPAQIFHYPIMAGPRSEPDTMRLILTGPTGVFIPGETVSGSISGATGKVERYIDVPTVRLNVIPVTGTFVATDVVTGSTSGATGTVSGTPIVQELHDVWVHEFGVDRVLNTGPESILSWFETNELGFPTGGTGGEQKQGVNNWTRIVRMEPDFLQTGTMYFEIVGKPYAHSGDVVNETYPFGPTTEKVEPREQYREFRLRFRSDTLGGNYQMGRVLLHTAPGDGRV